MEEPAVILTLLCCISIPLCIGFAAYSQYDQTGGQTASLSRIAEIGDGRILCRVLRARASMLQRVSEVTADAFMNSPSYLFVFSAIPGKAARRDALQFLFRQSLKLHLYIDPGCLYVVLDVPASSDTSSNKDAGGSADAIVSSFELRRSEREVSLWNMVQFGLAKLPFLYGWSTLTSLLTAAGALDEQLALAQKHLLGPGAAGHQQPEGSNSRPASDSGRNRGPARMLQLERMVVSPSVQGTGIGSKALGTALRAIELSMPAAAGGHAPDHLNAVGSESESDISPASALMHGIKIRPSALQSLRDTYGTRAGVTLTTQEDRNEAFYKRQGFETVWAGEAYGVQHWVMARAMVPGGRRAGSTALGRDGKQPEDPTWSISGGPNTPRPEAGSSGEAVVSKRRGSRG